MSDECQISAEYFNSQNMDYWAKRGNFDARRENLLQKEYRGPKVHVLCLIHATAGVLGHNHVEEATEDDKQKTITAVAYLELLKKECIPDLKIALTPEQWENVYWQQDGASTHGTVDVMACLRSEFGLRVIALKASIIWPPKSPDLSVLDYWLWNCVRQIVAIQFVAIKVDEVSAAVAIVVRQINTDSDHKETLKNVFKEYPLRLQALKEAEGAHFEYKL